MAGTKLIAVFRVPFLVASLDRVIRMQNVHALFELERSFSLSVGIYESDRRYVLYGTELPYSTE